MDYVFHFGGIGDLVPSIERPLDYMRANVNGTLAVLEAARHARVRKLVYAASSSCYGLAAELPTTEAAAIKPGYPYALSKYLGECSALHWGQVYGLPVISIRMFNVYGPRVKTTGAYGAVFGVFLAQKLHGKPFTVVGDGTQQRDFVYVTDVARAYLQAAESDRKGEIYNLGGGARPHRQPPGRADGGRGGAPPKRPGEPDCVGGRDQDPAAPGVDPHGVLPAGGGLHAPAHRGLAHRAAVDAREDRGGHARLVQHLAR